jgi:hypothetical protein
MKCIAYNDGYRYQLKESYVITIEIKPDTPIDIDYIALDSTGLLTIKKGYAWDGPSGPTIHTKNFMRGSLVHDALYQLMREGYLDNKIYRITADKILQAICLEDGMLGLFSWWVYYAVRIFADPAADPADKRPVEYAPKGCQP